MFSRTSTSLSLIHIYNFEVANVDMMRQKFDDFEAECHACLEAKLPLPAYDLSLIHI